MSSPVRNLVLIFVTATVLATTCGLTENECEFKEKKKLCRCSHRGIEDWTTASNRLSDRCSTSVILDLSENIISKLEIMDQENSTDETLCAPDIGLQLPNVSNNISTREPGAFSIFPSLQRLNLEGNIIQNISSYTFIGVGNLTYLDLSGNKITSICDYSFRSLASLKELHLQQNDIRSINRNHFKGLTNLQMLNITGNAINIVDSKSFDDLQNLRKLILRSNAIKAVDFGSLKQLKVLDLVNNRLRKVAGLGEISGLQELYLDDNDIRKLGRGSFRGLNRLSILSLRNNKLKSIDNIFGKGRQLRKLHVLRLSHNIIRNISQDVFIGMSDLRELWLDSNELTEIPSSLAHLTNLRKIVLSDNNLVNVDLSAIAYLSRLSVVVLSRNKIQDVLLDGISMLSPPDNRSQDSFNNTALFLSIQMICLEVNRLQTISGTMLQMFPNLELLHLAGNTLTCGCSSAPLSQFLKTHPHACGCDDVEIDIFDEDPKLIWHSMPELPVPAACYNHSSNIEGLTCDYFIESCSSSEETTKRQTVRPTVGSSVMLDCGHTIVSNSSNQFTNCWSYEPKQTGNPTKPTYPPKLEGEQISIEIDGTYTCLAVGLYDMEVYTTVYEVTFDYGNDTENTTTHNPTPTIPTQNITKYFENGVTTVEGSQTEAVSGMPITSSNTEGILLLVAGITIPILIIFIIGLLCVLLNITKRQSKRRSLYPTFLKRFRGSEESVYAEIDDLPIPLVDKAWKGRADSQEQHQRYSRDTDSYGYASDNDDEDGGYLSPIGESIASVDALGSTQNTYSTRYPENAHSYLTILDDDSTPDHHEYERCGQRPQRRAVTVYYDEPPDIRHKVMRMKSLDFDLCGEQESPTMEVRPHEARVVTQFGTITRKQKKQNFVLKPVMVRNVDDELPQECLKRTWTM